MAPAVVIELSQQVLAGTIEPDDALRRLVVAPFSAFLTGHPELTGNALVNNLPAPVGQADGLIDTIDDGVTEVATDIPNTVGPSAPQSSVGVAGSDAQRTDEADTETSPAPVQPEDDSENLVGDTKAPRLTDRRPSGQAGSSTGSPRRSTTSGTPSRTSPAAVGRSPVRTPGRPPAAPGCLPARLGRLPAAPGRKDGDRPPEGCSTSPRGLPQRDTSEGPIGVTGFRDRVS